MNRRIVAALFVAVSTLAFSQKASAQLIGPCPSPIMPAPCIVYDYKKMADWATTHAQDLQKLQSTIAQIREMEGQVKTIGTSLKSIPQLEAISPLSNTETPGMNIGNFNQATSEFNAVMFPGVGQSTDQSSQANNDRMSLDRQSNAEAFAYAQQNCRMIKDSRRRIRSLHESTRRSADLRGDWNVNSQIRAEMARTVAQKNVLLAAWLEAESTSLAVATPSAAEPVGDYGQNSPSPANSGIKISAADVVLLLAVVREVRNIIGASDAVEGNTAVIAGHQSIIAEYERTKTERDQALQILQTRAQAWASNAKRGSGPIIVNRVLAELNSMDASTAALRQQPVESLTQAFTQRNIDAVRLTANNVDPRQFIGTWADPAKVKNTLNISNTLLKGALDPYVDGDNNNDEFRRLVSTYNDLRLQEAWLRDMAVQARASITTAENDIAELNRDEGIQINTATTNTRLQQLAAQANTLAAKIKQSSDPSEQRHAQELLNEIQTLLKTGTVATLPSMDLPPADAPQP